MGKRIGFAASWLAATLLVSVCAFGRAQGSAQTDAPVVCRSSGPGAAATYGFPYSDPYLATVTSAALNADGLTPGLKREVVRVPVLPGRNRLPSLEGRGELSVALYRQGHPAPLLFVVPGIGSSPYFGLGTYLAGLFHREGFHVVVLPSPMSWNFALAASQSGVPGYTPDDARDLYRAMQSTLGVLNARYGIDSTRISFAGASLGALEGAYLSVIDAEERKIGIDEFLLLNPPVDLAYAIRTLDSWKGLQDKFGRSGSDGLRMRGLAAVEAYSSDKHDNPGALAALARRLSDFTTEELQFLIAEYVHTSLPELVYVTQVIHEQHVLTAARDQVRARLQEAKSITLMDYWKKVGEPSWRLQALPSDLDSLSQQGSLARVLGQLQSNPRVHIIHNADDMFSDRTAIEELKETMGAQVTLYPHGGHLGNLWYPETRECVVTLFSDVTSSGHVAREARATGGP